MKIIQILSLLEILNVVFVRLESEYGESFSDLDLHSFCIYSVTLTLFTHKHILFLNGQYGLLQHSSNGKHVLNAEIKFLLHHIVKIHDI